MLSAVFSSTYYQTRQNLLDIESLKVDDLDIHAYRYVMKPTLPIRRDSPKKAITLILAVLLGGMVGAGIVLGRNALRNYNIAIDNTPFCNLPVLQRREFLVMLKDALESYIINLPLKD